MPDSRRHGAMVPASRADWQSCAVRFAVCGVFLLFFLALWSPDARGDDLYETFNAHQKHGEASVDHARWEKLLQTYLHAAEDGLNRFNYEGLKKGGLSGLESYLQALQEVDPARLTIAEQFVCVLDKPLQRQDGRNRHEAFSGLVDPRDQVESEPARGPMEGKGLARGGRGVEPR